MSPRYRLEPMRGEGDPPLLIRPGSGEASLDSLIEWISGNRAELDAGLFRCGALLFRDCPVGGPDDFRRIVEAASDPIDYIGGVSPRRRIENKVYEASYFPPYKELKPHNEMSNLTRWPDRICFCCLQPSGEGGETPLVDGRKVLRALRPETRERFERLGIRYVFTFQSARTPKPASIKGWEEAFDTDDRSRVEETCAELGQSSRWNPDGSLTTISIVPAVAPHPVTGERSWFNQVLVRNAGAISADADLRQHYEWMLREQAALYSCAYGDGERIGIPELQEVDAATTAAEVLFPWQRGDVLVVDNLLCAHGRRPYSGPRDVLCILARDRPARR